MNQKLSYTIEEAAAALGLGRTTLYELIKTGELPRAKIGSRSVILRRDLEAMLERKLAA